MSRVVVVGVKSRMQEAVEAFYNVRSLHLIDHTSGTDGYSIGASFPTNSKASERLLKVRYMEKELNLDNSFDGNKMDVGELSEKISTNQVEAVEAEILKVFDKKSDLEEQIAALNAKKESLEVLSVFPMDLDLYSGYRSIVSIVGTVKSDPTNALKGLNDAEVFSVFDKKKGGTVAVFTKTSNRNDATAALAACGFVEMAVPDGKGPVKDAIASLSQDLSVLNAELDMVLKEIEVFRMKYKNFLQASDEQLTIEINKGEIPLRVAVGDYSYVLDAWVPEKSVESVKAEIEGMLGNSVHVELEETRGRKIHDEEHAEERFKTPPSKFNNGKIAKEFQYVTEMLSVPKYQEIDPTVLLMFFMPLLFGLMVGDCGYAIPFIILGAYGLKTTRHPDWRAIAMMLFFGGIWAFVFGFFFYGEALGMHFVGEVDFNVNKNIYWETLLGVEFPDWFKNLMPATEIDGHMHYGIGKLEQATFLLKLSVYIGIVHLFIGYLCGYINVRMQHNGKEAFLEKGGWILTLIGMVIAAYAATQWMFYDALLEGNLLMLLIAGIIILLAGVVVNFKSEGAQAILELPGVLGNILSYTRIAAIGMSKSGMALAFNYIIFGMMLGVDGPGYSIELVWYLPLVAALFVLMHLMIWTLAILSAGLHSLRLQFVEFMNKFFVGGGEEYNPLMVKREKTIFKKNEVKEV